MCNRRSISFYYMQKDSIIYKLLRYYCLEVYIFHPSIIFTTRNQIFMRLWFVAHRGCRTCWKYLSQLMYSLSWESCSLLVLTYCQRAWMMQERVWVWMPSRRARRGSSLNWGGWGDDATLRAAHFRVLISTQLVLNALQRWREGLQVVSTTTAEESLLLETVASSPGSPASTAECSARSRRPASSPGSRPSPAWWPCGATERAEHHTQIFTNSRCGVK